jgi:hypothetical protein
VATVLSGLCLIFEFGVFLVPKDSSFGGMDFGEYLLLPLGLFAGFSLLAGWLRRRSNHDGSLSHAILRSLAWSVGMFIFFLVRIHLLQYFRP